MKPSLIVLFIFSASVLLAGPVKAYSETISLPARDSITRDVQVNVEDVVSGRVTIIGPAINFSITDPDGNVILNRTVSNPLDFKVTAATSGVYKLHFENLHSDNAKHVTLNYNVQHYIFGFPQEFIILFAIVGFALIGVVVFVAMSPRP
jgi:hypothetical protein